MLHRTLSVEPTPLARRYSAASRFTLLLALLVGALTLASCGAASYDDATTEAPDAGTAADMTTMEPAMRELGEDEVNRYADLMLDLREMGEATDARLGDDPSEMSEMFAGIDIGSRYGAQLKSHGFTPEAFAEVHHNVMRAYGALIMLEQRGEIEASKRKQDAALEDMKGKVSDEQYQAMKQAMGSLQGQMEAMYGEVPAANIALVGRLRERLDTAFDAR